MLLPTIIYFSQIGAGRWSDLVRVVGDKRAKLLAVASDYPGETTLSGKKGMNPYEAWTVHIQEAADRDRFGGTRLHCAGV